MPRMFTSETARENGRKGGIASGKSKRHTADIREAMKALLADEQAMKNGKKVSNAEAIALRAIAQAMKGDVSAMVYVRDTAGQKPIEKVEVSTPDFSALDSLEFNDERQGE